MTTLSTDAIQWHEGMLLLPQHFQQSDLRLRELLHFHLGQVSPYHWGIREAKLNPEMFSSGILYFDVLKAIMPDGLVIDFLPFHEGKIELDLNPYKEQMEKAPLTIHLAVPKYNYGAPNATGDTPRFISCPGEEVVDENTGHGPIRIPKLLPNVILIAAEEVPSNFVSFPLYKIRKEVNAFILEDFIPPCLNVAPQTPLWNRCTILCRKIREKITYLSSRVLSEEKVSDILTRDAEDTIKVMTMGLLPLEALLAAGTAHPFSVYMHLTHLAGCVGSLQPGQTPPSFDPYHHNQLLKSFNQLINFINIMTENVQTGFHLIPFNPISNGFQLQLPEKLSSGQLIVGLKVPSSLASYDVHEWVDSAIIVSDNALSTAIDNRIRGAERRVVKYIPELKLHTPRGSLLIEIQIDSQFIQAGAVLKLVNMSSHATKAPEEIVLFVPK